jgi:hypothetical protein
MTRPTETPQQAARRLASGAIRDGFRPQGLHEYTDRDGKVDYWRIRAKHPETGEKWIRPMHLKDNGFELGEPKYPNGKPLYALHRIASNPDADVWVVEGEPKADALNRLGLVATTSGGATSAGAANWQPLRGRTARIWPDNDDPGKAYAGSVANILLDMGCPVSCIDVDKLGLGVSEDAVEWLAAHPGAAGGDVDVLPMLTGSRAEKNATGDDWPDPLPLPDALPPVAAFAFALLPETLQPWARDICERVQCAPDFVGAAIMAALGSVVGRKIGIRPQARTDWTVTPNQWALIVGRPGVLKSPALEAVLSPLKRLVADATDTHKEVMENYKTAVKLAKLRAEEGEKAARAKLKNNPDADVSHLLTDDEPDAPAMRRYIANDSTAAALGELLRQNHNGLLVFRDEMVALLKSLDREDNAEARGFYLTGWNGDSSFTFDRIGRGMNLHIPAVCLSLLGSTQPGRLAEYIRAAVRGGAGDDGLIQRFGLLVWPDIAGEWRDIDRWPDGEARREANRVLEMLDRFEPASVGAQQDTDAGGEADGIPFLRFDTAGHGLFLEWRTDLEAKLRSGDLHPALESHLAKYRKLVPGLALTLHLANNGTGPITERATLQALAWAEYLETHARRAYASVTTQEVRAAKAIIERLRKGDLARTFSSRDVWRPGWANLSDREQVADALRLLVDMDWLAVYQAETGGRRATVYEANPKWCNDGLP